MNILIKFETIDALSFIFKFDKKFNCFLSFGKQLLEQDKITPMPNNNLDKIEKLYDSIRNLKELGIDLGDKLIEETKEVEENIIKEDLIPLLVQTIEPIINQILRELVLVIDYDPRKDLKISLTQKRSFLTQSPEKKEVVLFDIKKSTVKHSKGKNKGLIVTFQDGTEINERYANETLRKVIDRINPELVSTLGIQVNYNDLVGKTRIPNQDQKPLSGGYFVITLSSTLQKKQQLEEITQKLNLGLVIEVIN